MADFDLAIPVVLLHEGGFADDPDDPGGATKYGISLRFLKGSGLEGDYDGDGDVDADDIRVLTDEDAVAIYKSQFWDKHQYEQLHDSDVATKVFDLSVNVGPRQSHKFLQWALRSAERRVTVDGKMGPQTIGAANTVLPAVLLAALRSEASNFYRNLARRRPSMNKFLDGWLKRNYAT